jgi:hypothetical protein
MITRVRAGARRFLAWLDAEDRAALGELAVRRVILAAEILGGAVVCGLAVLIVRTLGGF